MARVTISGDTFALDPVKYGKGNINSKAIQIGGGPIALTIENVTITSASRVVRCSRSRLARSWTGSSSSM